MIRGNAIVFEVGKRWIRAGYMTGGGNIHGPIRTRPLNPAAIREARDAAGPLAEMVTEIINETPPSELVGAIGGSFKTITGIDQLALKQALQAELKTGLPITVDSPVICGTAAEWVFGNGQFLDSLLWVNLQPKFTLGAVQNGKLAPVSIRICGLRDLEIFCAETLAQELGLHIPQLAPQKILVREGDIYDHTFLPSLDMALARLGYANLIEPSLPNEPYLQGAGALALRLDKKD